MSRWTPRTGFEPLDSRGYRVLTPHGSYSRYTTGACRCDECREANRIACMLRRHGLGPGKRQRSHGIYGYIYGCRCDKCEAGKQAWEKRGHRWFTMPGRDAVTSTAASSLTRAAPRGA